MQNETENAVNAAVSDIIIEAEKKTDVKAEENTSGERQPWYKLSLTKRIIYAVLSLILATLLWGYVLMTRNPDRTKTVSGVALSFEPGSEADLLARKLTVYGDIEEVLKPVAVTVSAPLTEVSKIKENNITATVSLLPVHSPGVYTLEVKASSTIGTVVSVDPSEITIEVDDIVSRSISVTYGFVGELPEGYWHDTPVLSDNTTIIEGARSDLESVSNAICYIDLTDVTESINSSKLPTFLDEEGNEIDRSAFKNVIPSVKVQMTVYPHKHVPIFYEIADAEQISDLFEVQSVTPTIDFIDVAAPADVLADLVEIKSDPVYIGLVTEAGSKTLHLNLIGIPEEAYVLNGVDPNNIQLTVVIVDKKANVLFEDVPIQVFGEEAEYTYTYGFNAVDVRVSGPKRLIEEFMTNFFVLSVNVMGRGPGEYDLMLEYSITDIERFADIDIDIAERSVHVVIANAGVSE